MKNTQCLGGSSWPVNAWNDCSWKFGGLLEPFFPYLGLTLCLIGDETSCLWKVSFHMMSQDSPIDWLIHRQCFPSFPWEIPGGKLRIPLKSRTLSGWNGWCFPFDGTSRTPGEGNHDLSPGRWTLIHVGSVHGVTWLIFYADQYPQPWKIQQVGLFKAETHSISGSLHTNPGWLNTRIKHICTYKYTISLPTYILAV